VKPASPAFNLEALAYFGRPPGRRLLQQVAESDGSLQAQLRLRAEYPDEFCRAAFSLCEQRRRAVAKFSRAADLYFDREGLEMATGEQVAAHRARRFVGCDSVIDLCCGIGGDLMALGHQTQVIGVDLDRSRLEAARHNTATVGLERVALVQASALDVRPRADAVFVDPARRNAAGRSRRGDNYSPTLESILPLQHQVAGLGIKISPAIDEGELPTNGEVEFVSFAGQCREGALYFGSLATAARRATVLPGPHTLEKGEGSAPLGPPGAVLYDPDPAVVRSHLIDELALKLDAWKLDPHIAYLSGDTLRQTPFARALPVLAHMPFQLKQLRGFLRQNDWRVDEIKKRGFPLEPEQLRRRLGRDTGTRPVTLVATRLGQKPVVFICGKSEH
jgi:hypothetical protein